MRPWVHAVAAFALSAAAVGRPRAKTVVSLSFDDSTVGQEQAGAVLAERGLHATFFIITGKVGTGEVGPAATGKGGLPGHLDWPQIAALAAQGHEIAGHTVSHPQLAKLKPAAQTQEICGSRAALVQHGFDPVTFAYPFDSFSATTESIVKGCGFIAARANGELQSATCANCPAVESIPPVNPFAIRTTGSVAKGQGLEVLAGPVERAMQASGGWTLLTFHYICNGCAAHSTTLPDLTAFADWLAAHVQDGTVVVRTIGDVVQYGAEGPPVVVPPPDLPEQPTPAAVPSPDLPGQAAARASGGCSAGEAGPSSIAAAALVLAAIRSARRRRPRRGEADLRDEHFPQ